MKTIILASTVTAAIGISILWVQSLQSNFDKNLLNDKLLWNSNNADSKTIFDGTRFLNTRTNTNIEYQKVTSDNDFAYKHLKPLVKHFPEWKHVRAKDFDVKDSSG